MNTKEIEYTQALAEINYILKYTDKNLVDKIPKKFMEHIKEKANKEYDVKIDENIPLEEQELKEKTKNLMAIIYRNYFCTPEEKEEYDNILKQNQEEYDLELKEKYSYDKLFSRNTDKELSDGSNNSNDVLNVEQTALVDPNNMKWYKKVYFTIKNWINTIFKKK